MPETKKPTEEVRPEAAAQGDDKELSLEECAQVTGGSIRNVKFTETHDISDDTRSRV